MALLSNIAHRLSVISGEYWIVLKFSSKWLSVSLALVFLLCAILDVGIFFVGPLVAFVLAVWALALLVRGVQSSWQHRDNTWLMLFSGLIMPSIMIIFGLLFFPTVRSGNIAQAWIYLGLYHTRYAEVINDPRQPDAEVEKSLWLKVEGSGRDRIFSFGYGGFISMERDIVYDPLDLPESRSRQLFGNGAAQCSHLVGHYYNCFLD